MKYRLLQPYVRRYGTKHPRPVFSTSSLRMAVFYGEEITFRELNDPEYDMWRKYVRR